MPDSICLREASPRVHHGEVLAAVKRAPLSGRTITLRVPEGASLATMVHTAFDERHRRYAVALVDGVEIAPEAWETVRPRAGQLVQLLLRPGDGDFFRSVLQIALIVTVAWLSAGAGGIIWASSTAAWALPTIVAVVGNLAINALVPLDMPGSGGLARPDPFHTLTGARNRNPLYQPAPMVFGKHRVYPPLWGLPIQETIGDEVYLRYAFVLGPAPLQVSDIKIGDTAITSFTGVEVEKRVAESDPPHTLYAGDPDQDAVGALLTTSFQTRTTATDVDEIEVVVGFRGGLGALNDKGRKVSRSVALEVEYRVAGTEDAWVDLRPGVIEANSAAFAGGEPERGIFLSVFLFAAYLAALEAVPGVASGAVTVTRADPGRAFQHRIRFAVPRAAAGYEVRVRRTSSESEADGVVDGVHWEILGSRKSFVDPFPERKLASFCVRIKASDQLSGIVDTINCVVEPKIPVFTSAALADPAGATASSFEEANGVSRNPAELILNLYRGPQNKRPRPDARINFASFCRFAKFCADNGLNFDEVVEGPITRGEMARRIAQAGYGRIYKQGGQLHVAIDYERDEGELPAQVFTPRNISNLRWSKTFPGEVHGVRLAFRNAANGWQDDEVIIYADGYAAEDTYEGEELVATGATIIEDLPVPGKTDADEVRVVGRQYFNNGLRQTEQFSFDMDAEAISVPLGAYALLQHDVIGVGLGAQRVASLQMDGDDVAGFTLDHPVPTEAGPTLGCRWRHLAEDGGEAWFETPSEVTVIRDAEDARVFTFGTARDPAEAPALGELVLIGETEQVAYPVLVRDIDPDIGDRAALTVIPYAPERFTTDGTLPAHNPMVTLPVSARPATPVMLSAIARNLEIAVSFQQPASPRGLIVTGYECALREHGESDDQWGDLPPLGPAARTVIAPAGDPGASYDVRIVAVGRDSGGLTVRSDALVVDDIAADDAPPAPADCAASFATRTSTAGAQQIVMTATWTANENPDVLDTNIEIEVSTGVWAVVGGARAALGRAEIHGLQVGRTYKVGFVNVSRRGAPSARTVVEGVTAPDTLTAVSAFNAAPLSPLDELLDDIGSDLSGAISDIEGAQDEINLIDTAVGTLQSTTGSQALAITALQAVDVSLRNAAMPDRPAVAEDFTTGAGGAPGSVSNIAVGTVTSVANKGDVRQFTTRTIFATKGVLPLIAGHTYRLSVESRVTVDGTANRHAIGFRCLNSSFADLGIVNSSIHSPHVVADGWAVYSVEVTASEVLAAQSTTAWLRPRIEVAGNAANTNSGATVQSAVVRFEDITDIAATNANVTDLLSATFDDNGYAAKAIRSVEAGSGRSIIAMGAYDRGDDDFDSDILLAANSIALAATSGLTEVISALTIEGTKARYTGDFNTGGKFTFGDVQWPVAGEPRTIEAADGQAVTWHPSGGALNAIPKVAVTLPGGVALAAGEAWAKPVFTGITTAGGTLRLRINVPGATSSVTSTTDSAGGGGNPDRVMDKSDAADAYNGVWNFRVQGTINVTSIYFAGSDIWFHDGVVTFSTWFNDGGGWEEGPAIGVSAADIFGFSSGDDETGAHAVDITVGVNWGDAIGQHGGKEFGVSHEGGGSLTDFVSVQWIKQSASGDRTGSPNGETATVVIIPDNSL